MTSIQLIFEIAVVLLIAVYVGLRLRKQRPLPPGPPGLPVVGNIFDFPREKEYLAYTEWRQKYGDVVSLTILGRTIIILNSAKVAVDLLNKRSAIYSDRPYLAMAGELVGWDQTIGLTPYGDRLRNMRRLMHQVFSPRPAQAFWPAQEKETAKFLNRLLQTPDDFLQHIRHTAGAIILKISHGYTVPDTGKDSLIAHAEKTIEQFSLSTVPGAWRVDFIPWVKYVPKWVPGAGFQRIADEWREDLLKMTEDPHQFTKDQMARTYLSSTENM